jgi:glycosyltransferase involved in cell wall biosynthesis
VLRLVSLLSVQTDTNCKAVHQAVTSHTRPIYFYPHRVLRDRHLDVIRTWPGEVLNRDLSDRKPDHVKPPSIPKSRRLLRHKLWLPNIKQRPKAIPSYATVFTFGGVVVPGPFITDLDNPYALTGYKVPALKLYRPLFQSLLRSPSCVQLRCLSQACRRNLHDELGSDIAARATVSYPRIEPQRDSAQRESKLCRFLFVGSQFEIKGGLSLLRAFARVRASGLDAQLTIVGHLSEAYRAAANEIGNVEVHSSGFSRQELFERFMSTSDVLIHPTFADSFGMAVLEAMAHGLAVIATRVYAIPEMVKDGENGSLLDPPLSIWRGVEPTRYFSDLEKLRRDAIETQDEAFEKALFEAMVRMVQDLTFRHSAQAASLKRIRNLSATGSFE